MSGTRRSVTVTEHTAPAIVVPRGRSKAEQRLAAIAALHQPLTVHDAGVVTHGVVLEQPSTYYVCGECKIGNRYGETKRAPWPCTTARLLGEWPGEVDTT